MDKVKKYVFSRRSFIAGFVSFIIVSCSKKSPEGPLVDPDPIPGDGGTIWTEVKLPPSTIADKTSEFVILGKGFAVGDVIILTPNMGAALRVTLTQVQPGQVAFQLPEELTSGAYRIGVQRGSRSLTLGSSSIEIVFNASIPDKQGMTVKGVVYVSGKGLANVVVSDGIEVTKTDANGIYYLPSAKNNGYVFVSIPGNYEVENKLSAPLFYKTVNPSSTEVEVKDFALTAVNNEKHVVMAMTDFHLANRNNDISQFEEGLLKDVNNSIQTYKSAGTKVYGLTMGDLTWDGYWYSNQYFLSDFLVQMNKINVPVFNTVGNHDNDPYVANDRGAEAPYRSVMGPTYYSFNLGKVHYVVLDNVEYTNTGASQGTVGQRNYRGKVSNSQMAWLKKDLEMITDKTTPIMLAMHIQLNNNPSVNGIGLQASTLRLDNSTELINAFNGFTNVNVLTGHTHINYAHENSESIMEHNTAAVCATWWWTGRNGYANNHICKDGSPGGYAIWEADNKNLKWQYKSIRYDKNYQFRAYDLNNCQITAAKYAPKSSDALLAPYAKEYATANNNNEVLINVWGYDSRWKVEVTEEGNPLVVSRVNAYDPLHIISYSALRLNANATPTEDFTSTRTAHMFKVKASNATNSLIIKVTDRFGRVFTETMVRPKALTLSMK